MNLKYVISENNSEREQKCLHSFCPDFSVIVFISYIAVYRAAYIWFKTSLGSSSRSYLKPLSPSHIPGRTQGVPITFLTRHIVHSRLTCHCQIQWSCRGLCNPSFLILYPSYILANCYLGLISPVTSSRRPASDLSHPSPYGVAGCPPVYSSIRLGP